MEPRFLTDQIERLAGARIQHGPLSQRIYLMKMGSADPARLIPELQTLAEERGYTKIFAKVPKSAADSFRQAGYREEALVPKFYAGSEDAVFLGSYLDEKRAVPVDAAELDQVLDVALAKRVTNPVVPLLAPGVVIRPCTPDDAPAMSRIYREVFPSYPFPIDQPDYLCQTMASHVAYFGAEKDGRLIALASAEMDPEGSNVEMTDFATLPVARGGGLALHLLSRMESAMQDSGMHTAFTIARAISHGMNITFAKRGYAYAGRLINNTQISGRIESMNVWFKPLRLPQA